MPARTKSQPTRHRNADQTPSPALFRSGVAARLAGIPVETLRVWERRYRAGDPQSSDRGRRLYSAQNIERLRLIKQLVDGGNPIGSIATLPMPELLKVRAASAMPGASSDAQSPHSAPTRVVLIGAASRLRWQSGLNVVGECPVAEAAVETLRDVHADIVVFELQSLLGLTPETVEVVKRVTDARAVIILYRFAPSDTIRRMREAGYLVAHANLDAAEIDLLCRTALSAHPVRQTEAVMPPPARFDVASLQTLTQTRNSIHCECPKHLAEILLTLGSFERYSSECSHRTPADADLHRSLMRAAGHARARLEEALMQVVLAEGLPLPAPTVPVAQ